MTTYDGKDFVLKISDQESPAGFDTIGGMQSNDFTLNNETVDVTNKSTAGKWRETAPFGIRSMSVSGNGFFIDDAAYNRMLTRGLNATPASTEFQIEVPNLGTFQGFFDITQIQMTGPNNEAVGFSISLESADIIHYTAS